jgi:hypothetical protein
MVPALDVPPGLVNETVQCFSTLHCDPSDPNMTLTTTSQCCLSKQGLAYSPPGSEWCDECVGM